MDVFMILTFICLLTLFIVNFPKERPGHKSDVPVIDFVSPKELSVETKLFQFY